MCLEGGGVCLEGGGVCLDSGGCALKLYSRCELRDPMYVKLRVQWLM